ncbi:MAG TPA: hypothetical protein VF170_09305, partial [Planctomycetaceae bacterium]
MTGSSSPAWGGQAECPLRPGLALSGRARSAISPGSPCRFADMEPPSPPLLAALRDLRLASPR